MQVIVGIIGIGVIIALIFFVKRKSLPPILQLAQVGLRSLIGILVLWALYDWYSKRVTTDFEYLIGSWSDGENEKYEFLKDSTYFHYIRIFNDKYEDYPYYVEYGKWNYDTETDGIIFFPSKSSSIDSSYLDNIEIITGNTQDRIDISNHYTKFQGFIPTPSSTITTSFHRSKKPFDLRLFCENYISKLKIQRDSIKTANSPKVLIQKLRREIIGTWSIIYNGDSYLINFDNDGSFRLKKPVFMSNNYTFENGTWKIDVNLNLYIHEPNDSWYIILNKGLIGNSDFNTKNNSGYDVKMIKRPYNEDDFKLEETNYSN